MAAQIPVKNDPEANKAALERVREDKLREVWAGHDGTWVAHPGLIPLAEFIFDTYMPGPNQLDRPLSCTSGESDLLCVPAGPITGPGLSLNVDVGLQYLAAWLGGNGCVPIYNLMEDMATAEICRAQVWQWLRHGARMDDGRVVTSAVVGGLVRQHVAKLSGRVPHAQLSTAAQLFEEIVNTDSCPDFLSMPAYEHID